MKMVFLLTLGLAALSMALPAFAAPWCATPLAQWSESFTLEGFNDQKPPFGKWEVNAGLLVGEGQKPVWSTILAPGDQGANQKVTVRFRIIKGENRPLALPGGCARWRFWYGENISGWDFGTVLRYQDGLNFYRVQLSAARGQLALWDANGGFLQVVPCPVKTNTTHTLEITARGAHLQAALDGRAVMDYWDRTLPPLSGQVGLAAYMSTVQVEQFAVTPVPAETGAMPAHKPNLHFETLPSWGPWGSRAEDKMIVLWDGNEPITFFMKIFHPDPSLMATLTQPMVKLRPGWRPAYASGVGPRLGSNWPQLVGTLPEAFAIKNHGDTASAEFTMTTREIGETSRQLLTVRWDPRQETYRYEYDVKVQFNRDTPVDVGQIEVVDPVTFNNRNPGPEVVHRWQPAAHRWWLVEAPDRTWVRMPMVNFHHITQETPWEGGTNLLCPDPGAAPAFEISYGFGKPAKWKSEVGMCLWGYDFHTCAGGPAWKAVQGEVLPYRLVLTAWSPENAKQRFENTKLLESAAQDTTRYIVFDPAGGPFTTTTLQDPSSTMVWVGNAEFALDDEVRRAGRPTLRFTGQAGLANGWGWGNSSFNQFFHYAVETYTKRWLIAGWYKSQGGRGRGLNLRVKYAYGPKPEEVFYIGGLGDQDWTQFAFVTSVLATPDCSHLTFELDGSGQVWLDGLRVRGLREGEEPKVTTFPVPPGLVPSTELTIDLPLLGKGPGALYDESHNGHSMAIGGAEWRTEDGRNFLHFAGQGWGHIDFKPPLHGLAKPDSITQEMMNKWGFPHEGSIFPLKEFTYEWWMRPEAPAQPAWMYVFLSRWNPICRLHVDPKTASLFYQGDIFCGEKIRLERPVAFGKWTHVVITHGKGKVILYLDGQPAAEANYDPAGPGFWQNRNCLDFFAAGKGGGSAFRGDMGPFRLYTTALAPEAVAERCRSGWTRGNQ